MGWAPIRKAEVGDIIQVAGSATVAVGDTVGGAAVATALETPTIDPPTLSMTFGQNDSPLAGREGAKLTCGCARRPPSACRRGPAADRLQLLQVAV